MVTPYKGGKTNTGDAISYVTNEMLPLGRDDVAKVIVLLTDGGSQDKVSCKVLSNCNRLI